MLRCVIVPHQSGTCSSVKLHWNTRESPAKISSQGSVALVEAVNREVTSVSGVIFLAHALNISDACQWVYTENLNCSSSGPLGIAVPCLISAWLTTYIQDRFKRITPVFQHASCWVSPHTPGSLWLCGCVVRQQNVAKDLCYRRKLQITVRQWQRSCWFTRFSPVAHHIA